MIVTVHIADFHKWSITMSFNKYWKLLKVINSKIYHTQFFIDVNLVLPQGTPFSNSFKICIFVYRMSFEVHQRQMNMT